MLDGLKKKIQNSKLEKCIQKQNEEVALQKDRYARWVEAKAQEKKKKAVEGADCPTANMARVDYEETSGGFSFAGYADELLLFVDGKAGEADADAEMSIAWFFAQNPETDLVYADEDYAFGTERMAPWMKPDFSPDTLLSFQYIGHLFAVRRSAFEQVEWKKDSNYEVQIYDFLLKAGKPGARVGHIPEVLFHNRITAKEYEAYRKLEQDSYALENPKEITADDHLPWKNCFADQDKFDEIRMEAAKRLGYKARIERDRFGVRHLLYEIPAKESGKKPMVSIVIPSKDNPEVLERCLRSIYEKTGYDNYEVIVVDNGSAGSVRAKLMILEKELGFAYYYKPMDFNFSVMVNYGVNQARGEYVLLLNDDCEVLDGEWLTRMLGQAQLPHVGAVGAKLLYPNSDLIQHAGVTNLAVGPAHKLQQFRDSVSFYYGRNRMVYDYIGVTAACILVSKKIYLEVGGFDENIRVAFNDVDFCFKLIEAGYYNVQRNDVILYHYESLSRGDDLKSDEKTLRMLAERDKLYDNHPNFWGKDPFYSVNLLGMAVDYIVNFRFEHEKENRMSKVVPFTETIPAEWYNDTPYITIEHCMVEKQLEKREDEYACVVCGWGYVLDQDNARYDLRMILERESDNKRLETEVVRYWRPDVPKILPEQKHVELSGFITRITKGDMEPGNYRIFLLYQDKCSRQRLYKDSGSVLEIH